MAFFFLGSGKRFLFDFVTYKLVVICLFGVLVNRFSNGAVFCMTDMVLLLTIDLTFKIYLFVLRFAYRILQIISDNKLHVMSKFVLGGYVVAFLMQGQSWRDFRILYFENKKIISGFLSLLSREGWKNVRGVQLLLKILGWYFLCFFQWK